MSDTEHILVVVARLKTNRKKMTTTIVLPEEVLEESAEVLANFLKGLRESIRLGFERVSLNDEFSITRATIAERERFTRPLNEEDFEENSEWKQLGYKVGDEIAEYMYWGNMELNKDFFEKEEE